MRERINKRRALHGIRLFCAGMLAGNFCAPAQDAAQLMSVSVPAGTSFMPGTVFTQTWTFKNTGTTPWTPRKSGYTLNLVGLDSLGAVPLTASLSATSFVVCASMTSGSSIPPGAQVGYSMSFIAPEAPGAVSDAFTLTSSAGVHFGPAVTMSIVVAAGGSTNQYDRSRAISYANNYSGCVNSDGYFWTDGSTYNDLGAGAPVPTAELGDDCAHFVSSCLGSSVVRGGGMNIPTRVPPTYGEPGVARLVNTCLIAPGFAKEVFSQNSLEPGDIIAWNWEGDTNIADLDHATLYLGHGLLASHSGSAIDVSDESWFQNGEPDWVWHLIHLYDTPTIAYTMTKTNLVMTWGTNWSGYAMYSAPSLASGATWTKVSKSPVVVGVLNRLTNAVPTGPIFYRLMMP